MAMLWSSPRFVVFTWRIPPVVSVPTISLKAEREPSAAPADPSRPEFATAAALAEAMALITSGPIAFSSNAVDSFARCSPFPDCPPPPSISFAF